MQMSLWTRFLSLIGMTALALFVVRSTMSDSRQADAVKIRKAVFDVRIPFVRNIGQTDPSVAYYASTFSGTVFVTRDGKIVYSLPKNGISDSVPRRAGREVGWSLVESPVEAETHPSGTGPATTQVSYFLGNDPTRWRTNVPTFESVSLGEVWPGIQVDLRAHGNNVEKIFTVEPHQDPSQIRMRLAGAQSLTVGEEGALVVRTGIRQVAFTRPLAYQTREGVRHSVMASYEVQGDEYGFHLGDYDRSLPVSIDPVLQATYLGGAGSDYAVSVAIHPTSGDVYVGAQTLSANFPGTAGGAQPAATGNGDSFVGRLNPALTTIIQGTYLGGNGSDSVAGLSIHPALDKIFVAGTTTSSDFPGTGGGAQAAHAGDSGAGDAFAARLNSDLTVLEQATYLGGNALDTGYALAIHPISGDVYIAGRADSSNLPGAAGGAQPTKAGFGTDSYVARFNANLTALMQTSYLGGSSTDIALALAADHVTGDVYVSGYTFSTNFPASAGGAQTSNGGVNDAFVARFNSALTVLGQTTYLGGSSNEIGFALTVNAASGEIYVAGESRSSNFPGTTGGAQPAMGASVSDAFVARLNPALTMLHQATYLGAGSFNDAHAVIIHPISGEVYVTGATQSTNFPGTTGGAQPTTGGYYDAFVARLSPSLTALNQATYLGGGNVEVGNALAIHPSTGDVYLAGHIGSNDLPHSAGGAQAMWGGSDDGFLALFTADLAAVSPTSTPTLTPTHTSTPIQTETPSNTPTPTATPTPTPILDLQGPLTSNTAANPNPR
jgi:hypothetical protein